MMMQDITKNQTSERNEKQRKTAREIIEQYDGPPVRIMEVCGTHTHEIFRLGIRKLLPKQVELISGPGCPVCVTPVGFIDEAVWLALQAGVTVCTFGDLVRVPGTKMSLAGAREKGAKIQIVYSPADAEKYARLHPEEQVVFLSVGFETTTPSSCLSVKKAKEEQLENYSILTANKTMPGAYEALKGSADVFLYPGHVNAITGTALCESLTKEGVSGVVAGFTAKELLTALAVSLKRYQEGKPFFVNCYPRVVTAEGSKEAQRLVDELMESCDSEWRGLGVIPDSGMKLRKEWEMFDAFVASSRIFDLLDQEEDKYLGFNERPVFEGDVKFEHVTFAYDEKPVLKDINMHVKKGQFIGLVGHTGSGKSTLMILLQRFYDLQEGVIKIDDIDFMNYTKQEVRSNIGYVLQEPALFSGTIKSNITLGIEATDEEVEKVLKLIGAEKFVNDYPKGINTELAYLGGNLSTGEKQLISFARILLRNPSILILDEATANIDTETEIMIQNALKVTAVGRTTFVVAHRLSTIRNADNIFVLDDGEIVEQGTHEELYNKNGKYRKMYEAQYNQNK